MKLRFVKFLTSRENEIEEKEDEDGTTTSTILPPGRDQSLPSTSLLPPSPHSLPPPVPPPAPLPPSLSSATCRKNNILQLSLPSCSASPFLLHKITEAEERGEGPWRGASLADPAVLLNDNTARPARRHPCYFIQSGSISHLPVSMAVHPQRMEL